MWIVDSLQMARDRAEAPLYGDSGYDPWMWFFLTALIAFAWVRVLKYME